MQIDRRAATQASLESEVARLEHKNEKLEKELKVEAARAVEAETKLKAAEGEIVDLKMDNKVWQELFAKLKGMRKSDRNEIFAMATSDPHAALERVKELNSKERPRPRNSPSSDDEEPLSQRGSRKEKSHGYEKGDFIASSDDEPEAPTPRRKKRKRRDPQSPKKKSRAVSPDAEKQKQDDPDYEGEDEQTQESAERVVMAVSPPQSPPPKVAEVRVATVIFRCPDSADAALIAALEDAIPKFGLKLDDYKGKLIFMEILMNMGDCCARARRKFMTPSPSQRG